MDNKIETKPIIRAMQVGEMRCFPIRSRRTVRTNVSDLNAEYFAEGRRWESSSDKEQAIVWVKRTS